jgi:pyruvate ferredoxin oxidoreductase gamma subunit/2-oxoisovalerate ferredoxin oxidoreductase gamma subunit
MYEIRFHGRGGQGGVTAAEILTNALLYEGKYTQNFPKFGIERRGAPIEIFLRMDEKQIFIRSQVYQPDCVVVFDSSLIEVINTTQGLKPGGWLIINDPGNPLDFRKIGNFNIVVVNATNIALKHSIGSKTSPIINTVILGAVVKILGISLDSLKKAIIENLKSPSKNIAGATEAYKTLRLEVN